MKTHIPEQPLDSPKAMNHHHLTTTQPPAPALWVGQSLITAFSSAVSGAVFDAKNTTTTRRPQHQQDQQHHQSKLSSLRSHSQMAGTQLSVLSRSKICILPQFRSSDMNEMTREKKRYWDKILEESLRRLLLKTVLEYFFQEFLRRVLLKTSLEACLEEFLRSVWWQCKFGSLWWQSKA